ncbi:hypothetical protein T458_05330 [Brevibacillus panacihumi W25]|uniref:Uncharacterized protein n=1 Tax=Brevibacillus panacihumi W25 TaxID=1408254 RepID=V6MJY1_9BACL|nr:hypothetical protein [Brevibacillus panacihumi]EST55753.1 hypothetical protein T458_05330 [Brevibacillus panacihumi W25]
MLGVESIIPIAEKTFTGIHSINYNQTVFSESIFLITNSSLKIVYLYTPFDFKYKILFEDKDFLNVFGKIKVHTLATEKCRTFPNMKKALPAN